MSVQFIKSARPGKPVTWYIYAYRGGPLIRKVAGPKKPKLTPADLVAIGAAIAETSKINPLILRAPLREWCPADPNRKGSPEWEALSENTKRVWRSHVDAIEARWGDKPIGVWSDPRMVAKVVKWRDERAATPRTADIGVTVLSHLLEFMRLRGRITMNVARDVPTLYSGADRAEIIWTQDDIARFEAVAAERNRHGLIDGLRLAAVTGLRREDLVTLTWSQVGEFAIVKKALKVSRRKRRRVVIPQTPQLEAVLADLRQRRRAEGVDTVLVTHLGKPWTANGFGVSFSAMKKEAGIVHVDEDGNERPKHLHDVRGTFCTMLLTEWGTTDEEAADIMGWSPTRVARIRKVYVDHLRVVVALGERIAAKQFAKQSGSVA